MIGKKEVRWFLWMIVLLLWMPQPGYAEPNRIVINLADFRLLLHRGGDAIREYPVAIGTPSSPTPLGKTAIASKVKNPIYYPRRWIEKNLSPIDPGPENPVGTRWLGLRWPFYGIHGTNNPDTIGKAVSLGCIRMHNHDIEELFELIEIGTPVWIIKKQEIDVELAPDKEQTRCSQAQDDPYILQVGAFQKKENALTRQAEMKAAGYEAEIVSGELYRVQLKTELFSEGVEAVKADLEEKGFSWYKVSL